MIILITVGTAFLAGMIAGSIALLCASIRREESRRSIQDDPPTRGAMAARRLVGWHGTRPVLVVGPGNVARWTDGTASR
jgi:hypothetical protein